MLLDNKLCKWYHFLVNDKAEHLLYGRLFQKDNNNNNKNNKDDKNNQEYKHDKDKKDIKAFNNNINKSKFLIQLMGDKSLVLWPSSYNSLFLR